MQPLLQNSRIDVVDFKAQIVKKLGSERSKWYFYYLNRLLTQKLSKIEFDRLCFRVLGRENLQLHNQFIRSILRNACHAKTLPPVHEAGPTRSSVVAGKISTCTEDGHEQSGSIVPSQKSNGVVLPMPMSPRKGRSTIRERKLRDRPSPLGPNGKADSASHQSMGTEDSGLKTVVENGTLTPCDYQRPMQYPQGVAEQPDNGEPGVMLSKNALVSRHGQNQTAVEDGEEVEQANKLNISRSPLLAPLGIPFCSASVGGARKALPVAGSSSSVVSYFDSSGLSDTDTLRKYMEQIAAAQGLGGVSMECANMLNNMLDLYLKRLIRSCIDFVGSRSAHEQKKHPSNKQQLQGKIVNGTWSSNHLPMQSSGGPVDVMQEQSPHSLVSLLDFKVAMELNPQQLGENWPLLLEKICMHWFEE